MTSLASDPDRVHEILAILLGGAVIASAVLAIVYIRILGRFFDELNRLARTLRQRACVRDSTVLAP